MRTMDIFKQLVSLLFIWTYVVIGNVQLKEDSEIDCTVNCTCCIKQECGKGKWFDEKECTHGCIDGYKGARCFIKCTHDCKKCDDSEDKCSVCKSGRYGFDCTKNCSVGCVTKSCPINGKCKCNDNFLGDLCDKCNSGKYGALCKSHCPVGCKGYVCNRTSGECSDGCVLASLTGAKCDKCIDGFYGEMCNRQCSTACTNGTCQKDTGDCLLGCIEGFNGSNCNRCINGMPEWSCVREFDVEDRNFQASEESTKSTPNVTVAILIAFLAVSAVSNIAFIGRLFFNGRVATESCRNPQRLKETIVDAVYENTKSENVETVADKGAYSDLEKKQDGSSEHPYSAVLSPTETKTTYVNVEKTF